MISISDIVGAIAGLRRANDERTAVLDTDLVAPEPAADGLSAFVAAFATAPEAESQATGLTTDSGVLLEAVDMTPAANGSVAMETSPWLPVMTGAAAGESDDRTPNGGTGLPLAGENVPDRAVISAIVHRLLARDDMQDNALQSEPGPGGAALEPLRPLVVPQPFTQIQTGGAHATIPHQNSTGGREWPGASVSSAAVFAASVPVEEQLESALTIAVSASTGASTADGANGLITPHARNALPSRPDAGAAVSVAASAGATTHISAHVPDTLWPSSQPDVSSPHRDASEAGTPGVHLIGTPAKDIPGNAAASYVVAGTVGPGAPQPDSSPVTSVPDLPPTSTPAIHAPARELAQPSAVAPPSISASVAAPAESADVQDMRFVATDNADARQRWAEGVGRQLLLMNRDGISTARLRLDPPSLGMMAIQIQMTEQGASVSFVVQHAVVRDALEQQVGRLQELFQQQQLDLLNVSVSDQGRDNQRDEHARAMTGQDTAADDAVPTEDERLASSQYLIDERV